MWAIFGIVLHGRAIMMWWVFKLILRGRPIELFYILTSVPQLLTEAMVYTVLSGMVYIIYFLLLITKPMKWRQWLSSLFEWFFTIFLSHIALNELSALLNTFCSLLLFCGTLVVWVNPKQISVKPMLTNSLCSFPFLKKTFKVQLGLFKFQKPN